jgi:hypothetical protein
MFPLLLPERSHGDSRLWSACFWLLNLGLFLRLLIEPLLAGRVGSPLGWLLLLSALLQGAAGLAFVLAIWPRVRGR